MIEGLDAAFIPPMFLAKGSYVTLSGKSPFRHLIYPLTEPGGLGVHLTLDMGGGARFGPNVEWLDTKDPDAVDYAVASNTPHTFAPRIAIYWPAVHESMLTPGYAGVRPKLAGQGQPNADFRIDGPAVHGQPGLIDLFGIESPGLTSSLAIADHVRELLDG
jgi:L-2-hydroxyglutarate oxidase LhgO